MSKICKKRVHENDKKNLPWLNLNDFKKCPGLLHFPLLVESIMWRSIWNSHWKHILDKKTLLCSVLYKKLFFLQSINRLSQFIIQTILLLWMNESPLDEKSCLKMLRLCFSYELDRDSKLLLISKLSLMQLEALLILWNFFLWKLCLLPTLSSDKTALAKCQNCR